MPYNSKRIKYLILRPETIKSLEENIDEKLRNIGSGNDFLEPKAQAANAKIDKWDYTKLKNFSVARETIKE